MALVMQLRSRCKKGCQCEKNTTFDICSKSTATPADPGAPINPTRGKCDEVSTTNIIPSSSLHIKDRKSKSNGTKKNSRGKMKTTKDNQNCKILVKKTNNKRTSPDACSKADAEAPMRVRKLMRSGKEQTKGAYHQQKSVTQTMMRPKPKKPVATVVVAVPIPETVHSKPSQVVKKRIRDRTSARRNPRRKCVLDGKDALRQIGSKTALKRQVDEVPGSRTNRVCENALCTDNGTDKQVPSTSSCSAASIMTETQNITAKTREVEREVAELQEQLSRENAQIAKLKKLLAKRQTVRSYVDKRKGQVRQAESKKLMQQLDKKESQMEERTTQLERRLTDGARNNQKEMQKLKKHLVADWQKKVNKTQSAISKMRHELRTKVVTWKNEKEALELKHEKDRERQKKMGSRHNFYKVCERQLKKKQADLEKQKTEVQRSSTKTETEKTTALKKIDDELSELKMYIHLLAMSPKEYLRASAKRKESEKLSAIIEEDLQCTICSEILMQSMVLNCSHTFCKYCIARWTKRKDHCPVCRTTITSKFNLENLDHFIDKIVIKFDNSFQERRKKALEDRKEQEKQLRALEDTGYFDEQSDDDSSDDDFWDVWDDDDDDDLSILGDDEDGWGDWDDDDDDVMIGLGDDDDDEDDDDDTSSDDDDDEDDNDFADDSDGSDDYDCVIS